MSKNTSTTTSSVITQITGKNVTLLLSKKLQNQIKYLCSKVSKVEWSGTLFYRIKSGSYDKGTCIIIGEELYLQDIGSEVYTEYTYGTEFIKLMMNNPRLQDCKISHIHSHQNMGVFFSGTDNLELYNNSAHHNHYLSLIVNNAGDMCARVAFRDIIESHTISYITSRSKNGKIVNKQQENEIHNSFRVMYYECDIIRDKIEDIPLQDRIDLLLKEKEEVKKLIPKTFYTSPYAKTGGVIGNINPIQGENAAPGYYKQSIKQRKIFDDWNDFNYKPIVNSRPVEASDLIEKAQVEQLLVTWLNQDFFAQKELNRSIAAVNTQIDTPGFAYFIEVLDMTLDDYYMNAFPEDYHLILFDKVMTNCVNLLKHYVADYEQLITKLMTILEGDVVNSTTSSFEGFLG